MCDSKKGQQGLRKSVDIDKLFFLRFEGFVCGKLYGL